jgi:antitoxin (DNA-binding transcriptional repressor) of toxin-antitoxin stability system
MRIVTIDHAKSNLSRLIQDVVAGEEIVIARGKTPVVRLVRARRSKPKREFGFAKGKIRIARDFDAPLADFDDYQP